MKALVLAAGYAVRLQPLTLDTPKPLLKVGGKSIVDRIIAKISVLKDLNEIYLVTNSRFYPNFVEWAKTCGHKIKISLLDDGTLTNETRLGAIRDIELAIKNKSINEDLLVIAGDNLFEVDMKVFISFAAGRKDGISIAVYDVGSLEAAKRYGVVSIDKIGTVVEFEEKPPAPKSTLISTGIYYFPKKLVPEIDRYMRAEGMTRPVSPAATRANDAPGYYIKWLVTNSKVYGFPFSEEWYDIGDIESYGKADDEYKRKENG